LCPWRWLSGRPISIPSPTPTPSKVGSPFHIDFSTQEIHHHGHPSSDAKAVTVASQRSKSFVEFLVSENGIIQDKLVLLSLLSFIDFFSRLFTVSKGE